MQRSSIVLGVSITACLAGPIPLAAQQSWKPIIIGAKPVRAVQWSMSVDTQRVVRDSDGTYSVFLRWTAGADSVTAPRSDRVEQHRLDCVARRTKQLGGQVVQLRDGKDAVVANVPVANVEWVGFERDGMQGEFFDSVCMWMRKAAPR